MAGSRRRSAEPPDKRSGMAPAGSALSRDACLNSYQADADEHRLKARDRSVRDAGCVASAPPRTRSLRFRADAAAGMAGPTPKVRDSEPSASHSRDACCDALRSLPTPLHGHVASLRSPLCSGAFSGVTGRVGLQSSRTHERRPVQADHAIRMARRHNSGSRAARAWRKPSHVIKSGVLVVVPPYRGIHRLPG